MGVLVYVGCETGPLWVTMSTEANERGMTVGMEVGAALSLNWAGGTVHSSPGTSLSRKSTSSLVTDSQACQHEDGSRVVGGAIYRLPLLSA